MVSSRAATVEDYLAGLPPERRAVIAEMRALVNAHLPPGYVETMNWGMISWEVPLSRYPHTYNQQPLGYAALAAQKNNYALYLMCACQDSDQAQRLRDAAAAEGKRLDMGKSCLRFRKIAQLPLAAVAEVVASCPVETCIAQYEAARGQPRG